ncbi:MAG: SseB family protein [Boseongicola sp.]|nr:SseB family protein [Boseongicola sp.]
MSETALDTAHRNMEETGSDEARLRFFGQFAGTELFLLLEAEAAGDTVEPRIYETEQGSFTLVFDTEDRLTAFAEGPAPYAAVSGRALAGMLSGQNIGIGLNLGVAQSAFLFGADSVSWLEQTVAAPPSETSDIPVSVEAPHGLPETLLKELDARLSQTNGIAQTACLVRATYAGGSQNHLMAFIGATPAAEPALAQLVNEALIFSGLEAGSLDVSFLDGSHPVVGSLMNAGLRFDLPQPVAAHVPSAPGTDPDNPPKLR